MLNVQDTALLVIDVQGKLAGRMHEREALFDSLRRLLQGARVLDVPILCTEQNPEGLGPTIDEILPLLAGVERLPKLTFSCCGDERIVRAIEALGRHQLLLAGIEAHVCVYQTAADLVTRGYEAHVVADAVSSRTPQNKAIGLEKARAAGASLTSVETALFELLGVAEGPKFKQILQIVK